jgi:hypothetical protein
VWFQTLGYRLIYCDGDSAIEIGATLGSPPVEVYAKFTYSPYGPIPESFNLPKEGSGSLNPPATVKGHQHIGYQQRIPGTKGEHTIQTALKWLSDCLNSHQSCMMCVDRDET